MPISEQAVGDYLVLVPQGRLVSGGPGEEYERRVQALLAEGHRHLVTDMRKVPQVDSTGIRALVRGHTSARRVSGSFKLVAPSALVRMVLEVTHLATVFQIYDSVEAAVKS